MIYLYNMFLKRCLPVFLKSCFTLFLFGIFDSSVLAQTDSPTLSFSSTTLSFSVMQNGSAPDQSAALSASTGSPAVTLDKSANSSWLLLPSAALGELSFNVNSADLAPGTYASTVTASAEGYTDATLTVTVTVTAAPALSFSPSSVTFSVTQGNSTASQSSALLANTGTPSVILSKLSGSDWLILPSAALGELSFSINSANLTPGTYTSTVTASADGYESATLSVTLTVSASSALSFSPASIAYSVAEGSEPAGKSSSLSANTGTPAVTLSKSANSDWLILPSAALGELSFNIKSANLAPGTYTATVTASADGYADATLSVSLTITAAPALSFSPTSLAFSVIQSGTASNKSSSLSANTGTPAVALSKSASSNWLVLPSGALGSLSFGINSSGLAAGMYSSTVTASAGGYASATLQVTLTITAAPALSFSPTSLAFSVVQSGTTSNKSSALSANIGTPAVTLSKSVNSNWLILPPGALGLLSFGINSSGLAAGTYTSTVTASAGGYASATLQVTLIVTAAPALSFSPASLAFSVVQNGTTSNKSSALSANTGTPAVTLGKSINSNWLILPSAGLGSLSFGINSSGLTPGTYTSTVTASAGGYASATVGITLTVTAAPALSFSPTSLAFSVVQNGTTANKSSVLSANTGTPAVTLGKSINSNWLTLPSAALGSLSFGINSSGLAAGTYSSTVTASAGGYASATLSIALTVTSNATALNIKVNFQDSATIPPSGWLRDYGQSYGGRTSANQGSGYTFGWLKKTDRTPLNLTKNGRKRTSPSDILLATFMHMQANNLSSFSGTAIEGIWEAQIANGKYDVTVSVGDGTGIDSKHSINVEGISAISGFVPTSTVKFKSATVTVAVADGRITIDATGGTNTKINWITIQPARPSVVSVNPQNGAINVSTNTSISTNVLKLPNGGINNATITSSAVYLTENTTGALVPSNVNGTGGGDAITLVPASALKSNITYKFTITSGVKDLSGASFVPYSSTFTTTSTATPVSSTIQFDKVSLRTATGRHSTLTVGPDGKLYALTIDGIIKRFTINADGTLGTPQLIYSLQDAYGTRKQRLAIGFTFDPSATAANLMVWITHSTYVFTNGPDWDGKLTKLSGSNLQTVTDVLVNLPRSAKDHLTNSIAFGPDGALYFTQGSNSAMGKADQTWSNRDEHLFSGSVLRLDVSKLGVLPLSVKTSEGGGTYSPYTVNAPLTIYASGVRNAFDLVWHSNGSLYVPTNGSAAGGNTPASVNGTLRPDGTTYSGPTVPALTNVQQTMNDFLFRVVKGGYYGHPNSLRGEYVLNGGNPTSGADNAEVTAYPAGTLPDKNWRGNAFNFKNNCSPDGAIEYKSSTFNGALKGKLLVVRYSQHDDIITLTPGTTKDIVSFVEGSSIPGFSGFVDPLNLTEDVRTGNIYVSEYGGDSGKITLLRPRTNTALRATLTENKAVFIPANHPNTIPSCDEEAAVVTESTSLLSAAAISNTSENEKPKISPNPARKRFNIKFPYQYQGDYTIQIVDPLGKIYEIGKKKLIAGGSDMLIDISGFSIKPGIYFLSIQSNMKKEVIKLVIL